MKKGKENLEEKVEQNTKRIWWLTIVMIVLLIAVGLGGYLIGASRIANEVVEQKNEVEEKGKETNKETPTENTQTEVKEIDLSKSLNTKNYTYSSLTDKDQDLGITIKINNDKKSVKVSYNTKALNSISRVTHSTSGDNYSNEIKGFNKNIKSTFISGKSALDKLKELKNKHQNGDFYTISKEYFQGRSVLAQYGSYRIYKIGDVLFDRNFDNTEIPVKQQDGTIINITDI